MFCHNKKYYITELRNRCFKANYSNVLLKESKSFFYIMHYVSKSKSWIYFPIDCNGLIHQFTSANVINLIANSNDSRYFDSWINHYDVMN